MPGGKGGDTLEAWAGRTGRRRAAGHGRGGLRFAFYGRVSTEDWQDPVTSRARQRDQAAALVAGHGRMVAEFFDAGYSRTLAWARRPQAAALAGALADPARGWDAVVIGEYERAFYGGQYASMAPLFEHYGIQLWTPEVGGQVDWHADDHEETMLALGLQSRREIARTRIRVRTAMATQAREQGRYLGGRPPYGYRLADAGPHPNKVHASWGRRAHRLEPDPATVPVVRWMFAQRLAGHSAARITRALNDAGIPCPSAADPKRNPHRTGAVWTLRTVAAILANPRYTGRQVWNRQRSFSLVSRMHSAACLLKPSSCPGRTVMCALSSSVPRNAGTRDLAIAPCGARGGGDDPEDGVLTGDPLELRQRGAPVHRQVRPGSRGEGEVAPKDGRPVTGLDLLQAHLFAGAAPQRPARGP